MVEDNRKKNGVILCLKMIYLIICRQWFYLGVYDKGRIRDACMYVKKE
jgi:hypothetical protein